jgi:hypothetical protein
MNTKTHNRTENGRSARVACAPTPPHSYSYEYEKAGPSTRTVWGVGTHRLVAEIVGSNPTYGMDACLVFVLCCTL